MQDKSIIKTKKRKYFWTNIQITESHHSNPESYIWNKEVFMFSLAGEVSWPAQCKVKWQQHVYIQTAGGNISLLRILLYWGQILNKKVLTWMYIQFCSFKNWKTQTLYWCRYSRTLLWHYNFRFEGSLIVSEMLLHPGLQPSNYNY